MKFTIITFLLWVLNINVCLGNGYPETRPLQSISLNILGDASIVSLNFESLFLVKEKSFFTGKIGIGYNVVISTQFFIPIMTPLATIPHHITYNYGRQKHFLELGAGGTLFMHGGTGNYIAYPIIGYRLQPLEASRWNFRIYGQFPLIDFTEKDVVAYPFGLSAGFCF